MEKVLEYIVKEIVDNKDAVSVEKVEEENAIVLKVTLDPEDLGRVIGKMGKTANAIRTVVRALSGKETKKHIVIKFNE